MTLPLPAHPNSDRPRERLWALGAGALTGTELLAILLETGGSTGTAPELGSRLLQAVGGSWRRLAARPPAELLRHDGIGPAKGARLLAAFEIAVRLAAESRAPGARIRDPADVFRLLGPRLRDLEVEEFHLLALDSQAQVLRDVLVTRGLLNSSLVHPREVFRAAIAEAAAGIIVVHNHPSGDPSPSAEDRSVTRQLVECGRVLDIPVYDHVIVAGDRWTSLANEGML
jgi:DNA repair protein RadC